MAPSTEKILSAPMGVRTPSRVPDGVACYAIGDIHGRRDLLDLMLEAIDRDLASHGLDHRIIFLGDYVDRGPSSRAVIQTIIDQQATRGDRVIAIKGNHEQAMMAFLADAAFGPKWIAHGGRETLLSYAVAPPAGSGRSADWETTRAAFAVAMPLEHHNLLNSLQLFATIGDYVFVHAGVRPGVPMDQQTPEDLLWIRDDFLIAERAIEQTVVHGHTPALEPALGDGRIGVDTGAYGTGVLTAAKLIGDKVDILRVSRR